VVYLEIRKLECKTESPLSQWRWWCGNTSQSCHTHIASRRQDLWNNV